MAGNYVVPDNQTHNMVEVRTTAAMGNGLFASKPIPRGTRILVETPLIAIPSGHGKDAEISAFCNALQTLSEADCKTLDGLHCNTELITAERRAKIHQWCRDHRMTDTRQESQNAKGLEDVTEVTSKRYAIFNSNRMNMARGFDGAGGVAVYELFSRMNHSCVPNAHNIYNPSLQRLTVYANRDIEAGEQLFIGYFKIACRTLQERRASMKYWGFVCSYVLCTHPSTDMEKRWMLKLYQGLVAYDRHLPVTRVASGAGATAVPRDATEALRDAEEFLGLLKKQGLAGVELRQTYRDCAKYCLDLGLTGKALGFARKELELERCCIGTDTEHLRNKMKGAEYWLAHLEQKYGEAQSE